MTSDAKAIRAEVERREITRLCHLTPLRNLVHIATGDGLASTRMLNESERREFTQQDLERLDEHPDHISCSIEYPNAWYLRQRRSNVDAEARLFPDWVCLCIEPRHLWADGTRFCPRNAAASRGRLVAAGADAFSKLYPDSSFGAYGKEFKRDALPEACPTDEQAEVLVHRAVPLGDIEQIVVADESEAKRVFFGLRQLSVADDAFAYAICPEFFEPYALSALLRAGRRPIERAWDYRMVTTGA